MAAGRRRGHEQISHASNDGINKAKWQKHIQHMRRIRECAAVADTDTVCLLSESGANG